jgi:ribosomal protein S20
MRGKRIDDMSSKKLFPATPKLHFRPETQLCPRCANTMVVLKTSERTVVTMGIGKFVASETHLSCKRCRKTRRSEDLRRLVPFKGKYGYDVLVHVGKSMYLRSLNEKTVAGQLAAATVDISESEIRYLGQKFVAYTSICHGQSQLKMRLAMARNGGYILHIDGTCEGGSPHLFTGMDEISGMVLSSVKINSEKKEFIVAFLQDVRAKYGNPLAVVSDMGRGLLSALEIVFPSVPVFICHYHFLRDIGKDILDEDYRALRNRLKKSKIRTALKAKAKDFESKLGKHFDELAFVDADSENAALKTAFLIIQWIFDTSALSGCGFPFDMQHWLFYKRLVAAYEKIDELHSRKECKSFYQLKKLLRRIADDDGFDETVENLEKNEKVFEELRKALKIAEPEGKKGLNDDGDGCEIKSIARKVFEFTEKYVGSEEKGHQKMIEQIEKYREKLFADPIACKIDGKDAFVQPQRTNNVMERFFRDLKRTLRGKSGSVSLKRQIAAMMPDAALIKNLENEEYLEILLGGAKTLEERFAQIDSHLFIREFAKMRSKNRKIPADAKKLIKKETALQQIENLFFAAAS